MFRFMERLDFLIAYLALVFLTGSVAIAQPPPMPSGMPEIHTIELTDESAKNSIDTYITLREKYGNKVPPANKSQALSEGAQAAADVNSIVVANGFESTGEWQKTITSVVIAHGFLKEGNRDTIDAKLAAMQANPEIPAALKQQMISTLEKMRPSDNNMNVVKRLMEDPTYGEKLAQITE